MSQVKYVNNQASLKVWVTIDCPECGGDGKYEVGPQCSRPASECCGGCYVTERCEQCSGSGRVTTTLDAETIGEIVSHLIHRDFSEARDCVIINCDIDESQA